jgi:hypothetical protein
MATWASGPVQYVAVAQSSWAQPIQTPAYAADVTAGDVLLVAVTTLAPTGTAQPVFSISDSVGHGWYEVAPRSFTDGSSNHFSIAFFYATAVSGRPVVTLASSHAVYCNVSLSQWATGGLPFQVAGATVAVVDQTSASPSVSLVNAGGVAYPSLVIGAACQSSNVGVTFGAGAGWTQMDSASFVLGGDPLVGFSLVYAGNVTAGSSTPSWTQSSSTDMQAAAVALALGAPSVAAITPYVMTSFGSTSLALQVSGSVDGLSFYALPCNYAPHGSSVVRDPSSPFLVGNTWFLGHTNVSGTATHTIDLASSPNLLDWTYLTSIDYSAFVGSGGGAATVNQTATAGYSGSAITLAPSGSVTAGNAILVTYEWYSGASFVSVVDSNGNALTVVPATCPSNSTGNLIGMAYLQVPSGSGGSGYTVTVNFNSTCYGQATFVEYTLAANNTFSLLASSVLTGTGTTATTGSLTFGAFLGQGLAVSVCYPPGGTASAGFATEVSTGDLAFSDKIGNTTSPLDPGMTYSESGSWMAIGAQFVVGGAEDVVSPQFFRDVNGDVVLFAAGSSTWTAGTGFEVFSAVPTDLTGLTAWAAPTLVSVTGLGGYGAADPCPVLVGSTYYLYYAAYDVGTSAHQVALATGSVVGGPFAQQSGPIFTGYESPSVIRRGVAGTVWHAYLDALGAGAYVAQCATGIAGTFGSAVLIPDFHDGGFTEGASVVCLLVPPVPPSMSGSPGSVRANVAADQSIVMTGVGTDWVSEVTVFTVAGVSGVTLVSQTVNSETSATLVVTTGSVTGVLTVSDGVLSAPVSVVSQGRGRWFPGLSRSRHRY